MGRIIAGFASSHAYALVEPTEWDWMRERSRTRYKSRHGTEPPVHPKVAEESLEKRQIRYKRVSEGLNFLRDTLKEKKPDALILIGDDQNEHFKEDNVPQVGIYVGEEFFTTERSEGGRQRGARYRCHSELAHELLKGLVEREFDVAFSKFFPQDELLSHAHCQILKRLVPEGDIPIIPLFVNAIHMPAISPGRCYRLGQAIKEIVESRPSGERLAIYASGGLSHFPPDYPFRFYKGPYTLGSISEEFDRRIVELIARGEGEKLTQLTSQDLLENGSLETKNWIVLLGAMGKALPRMLAYEPFYSAIMGMGVAYWELEGAS